MRWYQKYILVICHYNYDGIMLSYSRHTGTLYTLERVVKKDVKSFKFGEVVPNNGFYQCDDYRGYVSLLWIDTETRKF